MQRLKLMQCTRQCDCGTACLQNLAQICTNRCLTGACICQDGSIWKKRVYHWRAAMEYFLIGMWRKCVPLLDDFDVVGAAVLMTLPSPAVMLIGVKRTVQSDADAAFDSARIRKTFSLSHSHREATLLPYIQSPEISPH